MNANNEFQNAQQTKLYEKLNPLFAYIPYLRDKEGAQTRTTLSGDAAPKNSVPIPVYDSTVLSFVKEAQRTGLMDRNYIYAYSKMKATTPSDERLAISDAKYADIDGVLAIMTKYVLMGMTKGTMWSIAVEEGIWLHCLLKIKELLDVYDHPLA